MLFHKYEYINMDGKHIIDWTVSSKKTILINLKQQKKMKAGKEIFFRYEDETTEFETLREARDSLKDKKLELFADDDTITIDKKVYDEMLNKINELDKYQYSTKKYYKKKVEIN